jgi:glyoxylate reductase
VSNTPGAVDEATATTALYLLISTMRNFSKCERSLRAGGYKPPGIEGASHDLSGRTLGILGLGSIGITFAHLVKPFNMRIVYHNRREAQDIPKDWTYYPNLEDMLTEADVLSIHMPLSDQTLGFVDEKKIRLMKPGSIIINTARGKIIDEDALINALNDGHVSVNLDISFDSLRVFGTSFRK